MEARRSIASRERSGQPRGGRPTAGRTPEPGWIVSFDAVVLGLGIMGSATVYQLARRGLRVLGLDAYERGHARGSSHGTSRAIRKAYFQAPQYVPLVERACTMWQQLEAESGQALLRVTGSLLVGPPSSRQITGTIASGTRHMLPFEALDQREVSQRFPGFRLLDDLTAVLEPSGGVLNAERCLATLQTLAQQLGAELRHSEAVRHWAANGDGLRGRRARRTPGPTRRGTA